MSRSHPANPRYQLVIFDFDGTLADTYAAFVAALQSVIHSHGLRHIGREELEGYRGSHGRVLMERLGVRWWRLPGIGSAMLEAMTQRRSQMQLFQGVAEAIEALARAGTSLAIVTSNSADNVRAVLGPSASHIRFYECGAALFGKAARFRRVLRQAGLPASGAVAVGDELRDLEAARKAGIDFAAVSWGYTAPEALGKARPEWFLHTPGDLERLVHP